MSMLGKAFHMLCVWMGLADASESHLTPSHGWLLPAPVAARRPQEDSGARRTEGLREKNVQA
jgi:hypothetical protein